jgi:hypothetical protein
MNLDGKKFGLWERKQTKTLSFRSDHALFWSTLTDNQLLSIHFKGCRREDISFIHSTIIPQFPPVILQNEALISVLDGSITGPGRGRRSIIISLSDSSCRDSANQACLISLRELVTRSSPSFELKPLIQGGGVRYWPAMTPQKS